MKIIPATVDRTVSLVDINSCFLLWAFALWERIYCLTLAFFFDVSRIDVRFPFNFAVFHVFMRVLTGEW